MVEETIIQMGLSDCADRKIGNWHLRGISGGEKKRVSIALEIVTSPKVLFLDEPTTGLDSASAFFVMQTLRQMAQTGKTVVSSVHQPSSDVFATFDDLCLLSSGETVYFGAANLATEVRAYTVYTKNKTYVGLIAILFSIIDITNCKRVALINSLIVLCASRVSMSPAANPFRSLPPLHQHRL